MSDETRFEFIVESLDDTCERRPEHFTGWESVVFEVEDEDAIPIGV